MKQLLVVLAVSLFATGVYAEKRPAKKLAPNKQHSVGKKIKKEEVSLDINTRGWLNEIRVKVYGFDPNRKPGKGGC